MDAREFDELTRQFAASEPNESLDTPDGKQYRMLYVKSAGRSVVIADIASDDPPMFYAESAGLRAWEMLQESYGQRAVVCRPFLPSKREFQRQHRAEMKAFREEARKVGLSVKEYTLMRLGLER